MDLSNADDEPETMRRRAAQPSASQRAYAYIRGGILSGELADDTFVEEEYISALIGVSRTPVREAFGRLQAEHLIDLVPRRGARVRAVTLREMFEFYEVRRAIEGHVARQICHARLGAPPGMAPLLEEMRRLPAGQGVRYVTLDAAFHTAMIAASHNEVLMEIYDSLSLRQQRVALTSLKIHPQRPAIIYEQHEALLRALEMHDDEAALQILDAHLRPIEEVISYLGGTDKARLPTRP